MLTVKPVYKLLTVPDDLKWTTNTRDTIYTHFQGITINIYGFGRPFYCSFIFYPSTHISTWVDGSLHKATHVCTTMQTFVVVMIFLLDAVPISSTTAIVFNIHKTTEPILHICSTCCCLYLTLNTPIRCGSFCSIDQMFFQKII